jgi:hypothetical protein
VAAGEEEIAAGRSRAFVPEPSTFLVRCLRHGRPDRSDKGVSVAFVDVTGDGCRYRAFGLKPSLQR